MTCFYTRMAHVVTQDNRRCSNCNQYIHILLCMSYFIITIVYDHGANRMSQLHYFKLPRNWALYTNDAGGRPLHRRLTTEPGIVGIEQYLLKMFTKHVGKLHEQLSFHWAFRKGIMWLSHWIAS